MDHGSATTPLRGDAGPRPRVVLEEQGGVEKGVLHAAVEDRLLHRRLGGVIGQRAQDRVDHRGENEPSHPRLGRGGDEIPSRLGLVGQERRRDIEDRLYINQRRCNAALIPEIADHGIGSAFVTDRSQGFGLVDQAPYCSATCNERRNDMAGEFPGRAYCEDQSRHGFLSSDRRRVRPWP